MKKAADELDHIYIKGAREHNLKSVEVKIPKRKLVVLTGVSGSGKSSLAFDTLYAEGQRRYVESLSAYAIQFLGHIQIMQPLNLTEPATIYLGWIFVLMQIGQGFGQ